MTLFVTDLDGTLLRSDTTISKYAVKTLNSLINEGVMFTYATARSFASASPLVKQLDLRCPAVIFNGVFVVDPKTGEHIIENVYSDKCQKFAREFFISENVAPLVYSNIDGRERVSYLENRFEDVANYVNSRRGDKRLRAVGSYEELFQGDVFYFTIIDPKSVPLFDSVFTIENGFARNVQRDTYDDMIWYEIYDKNASKANAVLQVKELVKANELVCFGDNFNDVSMIKAADVGIAVENACEELKKIADETIESNNNDGVVKFIDRRSRIFPSR